MLARLTECEPLDVLISTIPGRIVHARMPDGFIYSSLLTMVSQGKQWRDIELVLVVEKKPKSV